MASTDAVPALTDMPSAWLVSLVAALPSELLTASIRTCTTMRDLVFSERVVRIVVECPRAPGDAAAAKLMLADRLAKKLNLTLRRDPWQRSGCGDNFDRSFATVDAAFLVSCTTTLIREMRSMLGLATARPGITGVTLQDLNLDALVPSWLTSNCPNMTSLTLIDCHTSDLRADSVPACGQIKHLTLSGGTATWPAKSSWPCWQQQFQSLTGLQSLSFSNGAGCSSTSPAFLHLWATAMGSQLTHLETTDYALQPAGSLPAEFPSLFPRVSHLHLPDVRDKDMEVLLSMPTLRRLHVDQFDLQHSYTHRTCPWTQLGIKGMSVPSLVCLPLQGLQSIHADKPVAGRAFELKASPDLEENVRVVAAVGQRLHWGAVDEVCLMGCSQGRADQADVDDQTRQALLAGQAAVLPLLSSCKAQEFTLDNISEVTASLLASVVQHACNPSCTTLRLSACGFGSGVCALLVPSLPPTITRVELVKIGEEHVKEIRAHAPPSVTVIATYTVKGTGQG